MRARRNPIDDDFRFYRTPSCAARVFGPAVQRYLRPYHRPLCLLVAVVVASAFLILWRLTR